MKITLLDIFSRCLNKKYQSFGLSWIVNSKKLTKTKQVNFYLCRPKHTLCNQKPIPMFSVYKRFQYCLHYTHCSQNAVQKTRKHILGSFSSLDLPTCMYTIYKGYKIQSGPPVRVQNGTDNHGSILNKKIPNRNRNIPVILLNLAYCNLFSWPKSRFYMPWYRSE